MCIPQLFQPLSIWQKDFQFKPVAPNLSTLFRKFKLESSHSLSGIDASLFKSIGFSDSNELPIAFYRYQCHQKTCENSEGGYQNKNTLLCADPVHFEVGLNDMTLTQQITDLTSEETTECIEALNQHFKQDGLEFSAGTNHQWYLRLNSELTITTVPLSEVIRKNIAHFQPISDNLNWKVIQNEAQMILHLLPLNQKREAKGLATLNSLWFYGSGKPETSNHKFNTILSDIDNKSIAIAANCKHSPLPQNSSELLNNDFGNKIENSLIILNQLADSATFDDIKEYQIQLNQIDNYLEPIIQAWKNNKIELIIDSCTGNLIKPIRIPVWQFWAKKSRQLREINP